jgi:hypothetical protein
VHPDFHVKNLPIGSYEALNPRIKLIISFADTTMGHDGTVYKASNWTFDSCTGKSYYEDKRGAMMHKKTTYGLAKRRE